MWWHVHPVTPTNAASRNNGIGENEHPLAAQQRPWSNCIAMHPGRPPLFDQLLRSYRGSSAVPAVIIIGRAGRQNGPDKTHIQYVPVLWFFRPEWHFFQPQKGGFVPGFAYFAHSGQETH